jgi:hypothetical protein
MHQVSQIVQVRHVVANIAHASSARTDVLYPEGYEEAIESDHGTGLPLEPDHEGRVLHAASMSGGRVI